VSASHNRHRELTAEVAERTSRIVEALDGLDRTALLAPSQLPEWSRLTIACHLRYGAEAMARMTRATVSGLPVAYYPAGRERQRPLTLVPRPGERPPAVVTSLEDRGEELDRVWSLLDDAAWGFEVTEPGPNADLGPLQLARLPLLRLTEVEVHGTDLGLGLDDWGELFVREALPMRLDRLNTRRSNHPAFGTRPEGTWLLTASDGPTYLVGVQAGRVDSRPADPATTATSRLEATSRDLLALLLGRPLRGTLRLSGDTAFGEAFPLAFPGP